jgi:hypothetical protein
MASKNLAAIISKNSLTLKRFYEIFAESQMHPVKSCINIVIEN